MKQLRFLKRTFITVAFFLIGEVIYSQGMPIDKTTGKVTYTGEVKIPQINKAELTDKIAIFLSGYTETRGSIGNLYVNANQTQITGIFTICATTQTKANLWYINAAFTILVTDNSCEYKITNLYAYATTASSMYGNIVKDSAIEISDGFDIHDFEKKNDNAKNAHNSITRLLADLNEFLRKI